MSPPAVPGTLGAELVPARGRVEAGNEHHEGVAYRACGDATAVIPAEVLVQPHALLRAPRAPRGYVFATVWLGAALTLAAAGVLSRLFAAETASRLSVAPSAREAGPVAAIAATGLLLATSPAALAYRGPVGAALRG